MNGMLAFEEVALRHMARRLIRDADHCDLIAFKNGPSTNDGACYYPPAAVKLEDGFSDIVCVRHAREAFERGASILTPDRPDDWRELGWTPIEAFARSVLRESASSESSNRFEPGSDAETMAETNLPEEGNG